MRNFLKTISILTIALAYAALLLPQQPLQALPADQKGLMQGNVRYFDVRESIPCESASADGLQGSDNIESAFIYFTGRGLTANQSAGIVGNLIAESGVEPDTQEVNPIGGGRGGYGIAQWTSGRRVAIEAFAANIQLNGPASLRDKYVADSEAEPPTVLTSLLFQLDYLYDQELMKDYITVLEHIEASSTVREASDIFLHEFERPLDQSEAVEIQRAALGEQVLELYGDSAVGSSCETNGSFEGFPLDTTKQSMTDLNSPCLTVGPAMCQGGHPYAAYDIIAETGTPVISLFDGKVVGIGEDRCPGRIASIYSEAEGVTVSYLHMSIAETLVAEGDTITAGQKIGYVGTTGEGCTIPHLHIDAAPGDSRPGCTRFECPEANQALFIEGEAKISLGESLYQGYLKLP